jgi:Trk K+ transport system NAD-binding subunit
LLGAVVRGDQVEIARGDTVIRNGDRLIVLSIAGKSVSDTIERLLGRHVDLEGFAAE